MVGPSVFTGNTADSGGYGGAMELNGANLKVTGPLCAINNTAPDGSGSGFMSLGDGSAICPDQGNVSISSTSDGDIALGLGSSLTCGNSVTSWVSGGRSYIIQGPVCGCNAAFQNPQGSTVCRSCVLGFDEGTCACKVSHTIQIILLA